MSITATYSPEDNKLRIYSVARFDREDYDRLRAAGYSWAPKQKLFVAPMWTPAREDLAIELAGEIGDEDTSLVERAEQRSERFEGYQDSRAADAHAARAGGARIADNIPLGQPILVGHHSERHARRDAERIENGMRKAIKMWDTAQYWKARAAGAKAHARYKELPAVRARRIKGLESDYRKQKADMERGARYLAAWRSEGLTLKRAKAMSDGGGGSQCFTLAEYPRQPPASQYEGPMSVWSALDGGVITAEQARDIAIPGYERMIENRRRWLFHTENRLIYERAMLDDGGGLAGAAFDYEVGGQVFRRRGWFYIKRVNRIDGVVTSVSVLGHFASTITLDEITDYRPPAEGMAEKVKAATARGPMCNYPGEGFCHMTAAEWAALPRYSDNRYTEYHKATATHGAHRTKHRPMQGFKWACVFITDAKRIDPPALAPAPPLPPTLPPALPPPPSPERTAARAAAVAEAAPFEAIRAAARAGVKVVTAPQLFPPPADLAARMVDLAGVQDGDRVLEPSAGTGAILRALADARNAGGAVPSEVLAIEINLELAAALQAQTPSLCTDVRPGDFMETDETKLGGKFDRIVMNPPFTGGADVAHVLHAYSLLAPGGRLVAVCADGVRQNAKLRPFVEGAGGTWEQLPPRTFESEGTGVMTVLLVLDRPVS